MNNISNSTITTYSTCGNLPLNIFPYTLKPLKFDENSSLLPDSPYNFIRTGEDEYKLQGYNSPEISLNHFCYVNWMNISSPKIDLAIDYAYVSNIAKERIEISKPENKSLLDLNVIFKFKNIDSVCAIYSNDKDNIKKFLVVLNEDHYDFDLMNKIYSEIEFPIINDFGNKDIVNFEYRYKNDQIAPKLISGYRDLIFKR